MSRARTRPTRDETRQRLFAAAAAVFVREGIAGSSVEDICAEADLTRGALYSNFADKNELVMAMIDAHLERNMVEMERLVDMAASPLAYIELVESTEHRRDGPLGADPVLYMEFTLHALRNPTNRPRLADHQRRWRDLIASVVQADIDRVGIDPLMPVDEAAAMILAMDNGYLLGELIEPGSYSPGTLSRNIAALQQLFEASAANPATTATPSATETRQDRRGP